MTKINNDEFFPILLAFDQSNTADIGQKTAVFSARLTNIHNAPFIKSRVLFESPSPELKFLDVPISRRLNNAEGRNEVNFDYVYTVPNDRLQTVLNIIIELQDTNKQWYVYRLHRKIRLNFSEPDNGKTHVNIVVEKDAVANLANISDHDNVNMKVGSGSILNYRERLNSEEQKKSSRSGFYGSNSDYVFLQYYYEADLSKKRNEEENRRGTISKTPVKPKKSQLTCTAELSVLSNSELPKNIYLYSQPLITLGRTTDITDIALPLKTGLPEKESSYFSIFHGALWLDVTGLHYLPCGKNLDTLNDKELEQATEKRLWQAIADGDKIDFAGERISCSVAIKKSHALPHSATAPTSPLIEDYLNLLAAYNAYRKADRFAKKEASFTQAQKAKAVAEEKYDHLGNVFADFQQAQANTPINSSVDYVHLMYDEPQESVSHILLANTLTIGSSATAGLRANNSELHAHHAELSHRDNAYCIKNTAGDGLVWVNQNSLKYNDSQWLCNNDHIYLGANRNQALRLQIQLKCRS